MDAYLALRSGDVIDLTVRVGAPAPAAAPPASPATPPAPAATPPAPAAAPPAPAATPPVPEKSAAEMDAERPDSAMPDAVPGPTHKPRKVRKRMEAVLERQKTFNVFDDVSQPPPRKRQNRAILNL